MNAPTRPARSPKGNGCLQVLLGTIIVLLVAILASIWWINRNIYAREFTPVELKQDELALLDAKLNSGGKVEPHEIAQKTQMFTERYMVDWLLQNSLGPMWLAMCKKHGWTPAAESSGALARLEARRVEWRAKRDAGEVELTELMPLHDDVERRWAYYVPQAIPDERSAAAGADHLGYDR